MNTFRQLLQLQGQLQFCPAEGHCQVCFALCFLLFSKVINASMACLSAETACCVTEKLLKKAVVIMKETVGAGLATSK